MKSAAVRSKLARAIDPTKEINILACSIHHNNYPQFEALAIARKAYGRLKKVLFCDLLVTAQPPTRHWKEDVPYSLKEFRCEVKQIDLGKNPETVYRGLYERCTQRLNELAQQCFDEKNKRIAFILLDRDARAFFSSVPLSVRNEVHAEYMKRNPEFIYHVSDDVIYDGYSSGLRLSQMAKPPTTFGPNTIIAYGDHEHVKLVCIPPALNRVSYVRLSEYKAEVLALGELINYDFYQEYLWATQETRDNMSAQLSWLRYDSNKPAELIAYTLRCLAEFGEELSFSHFVQKLTKDRELLHDLPASELLEEIMDSPGLFKIVKESFVHGENKPVQLYRSIVDEASDFIKSRALIAFEEGRFSSYSDVCVPGVKRDFTFSFCMENESTSYTVSFTHQVE